MSAKQLMHVEVDRKQLDRALSLLKHLPGGVQKASRRAISAALTAGRKEAAKDVSQTYTVKSSYFKGSLSVRQASSGDLSGELRSVGRGLGLMHFSHRPKSDTTGTNRKQISVTVKKGRTKTLTTGFKSNRLHGNLFVRKGQKRLPIKKAISVSAPQMVGNPQIAPQVQERMQEQFEKRLDNQVNHLLNGGK